GRHLRARPPRHRPGAAAPGRGRRAARAAVRHRVRRPVPVGRRGPGRRPRGRRPPRRRPRRRRPRRGDRRRRPPLRRPGPAAARGGRRAGGRGRGPGPRRAVGRRVEGRDVPDHRRGGGPDPGGRRHQPAQAGPPRPRVRPPGGGTGRPGRRPARHGDRPQPGLRRRDRGPAGRARPVHAGPLADAPRPSDGRPRRRGRRAAREVPMKVGILAGGLGTRLAEETVEKPKPMVEIGGKPILWHIMRYYEHFGFEDFVIALGYKGEYIKRWFVDYASLTTDITVDMRSGTVTPMHGDTGPNWRVELVDTGMWTATGGRIKRLAPYLGDGTFMITWGDGVSTVDLRKLVEFHRSHGKLATLTAARPPA